MGYKQSFFSANNDPQAIEQFFVIRSICDTIVPKLVPQDVPRLQSLLAGVFPGSEIVPIDAALLTAEVRRICQFECYEYEASWVQKLLQFFQMQKLNHGVMLVGPVGTGEFSA